MKWMFILLLLLLTACAPDQGPENPYSGRVDEVTPQGIQIQWDTGARFSLDKIDGAYNRAIVCVGMSADPLIMVFTDERIEGYADGMYYPEYGMAVIYAVSLSPEERTMNIVTHESRHHILFENTGDADSGHLTWGNHC